MVLRNLKIQKMTNYLSLKINVKLIYYFLKSLGFIDSPKIVIYKDSI